MKMLKWFYPLSIFTFFGIIDIQAQCSTAATERASLIDFYNKTNGRLWRLNNWTNLIANNAPVCPATGNPWPGIKCNTNKCVTDLQLGNSGLFYSSGVTELPPLNLPNLKVLDLSTNTLSGTLNNFSFPSGLTNINLSNNGFTGSLPNLNLQELVEFDISENRLKDPIPPYSLPKLVKLALNANTFTGQIPNFNLPKLQSLFLQDNRLSGCLPRSLDTFCNRTPATTVNLNNNPGLSNMFFATFCGAQKTGRCPCPTPTATISNIKTSYCKDDPSVILTGLPTGGVFKIDGLPLTANTLNPSLLTVGTSYKITYTLPLTSDGCADEFSQTITITAPCRVVCSSFTANLSTDRTSVCQGSSTSLSFTFTGGSAPFTVRYSDGTTISTLNGVTNLQAVSITPTANITYTLVSATDANGCPATIGTNTVISIVNPTANITGALSFCAGSSTVLTATGGGSYTWTGGSTNATLTVTTAGTYTVTATTNGCPATKSVQVTTTPLPILAASVTNVKCNGGTDGQIVATASGGASPFAFSINPVPTGSTQSPAGTFNNLTAQAYTITVKDFNNCSTTSVSTVGQPTPLTLSLNHTNATNCTTPNGSIIATGGGGTPPYTYGWSNGATSSTLTNLAAGTYTVTMTDSKGCKATASAVIQCNSPCNLVLNQPTLITVCNAPTAAINVSWSGGLAPYRLTYTGAVNPLTGLTTTSQQISNLVPGNYTITVIDANNCSQVVNFLVTIPTLVSVIINSTNATNCTTSNGSASAVGSGGTPPYTYRWNNGATTALVSNLAAGTYMLTMTDSKGCQTTTTTSIACTPCNLMLNQPTLITVCNAPTAAINVSWSGGLAPYRLTYTGAVNPLTGLTTTSQQIGNLVPGNYTITVIDANNCSQVVNFLVTIPTLVSGVVNPTNATNCTTSNGSVSALGSGGTPPYTYRWNNGATTARVSNLAAGTYTLTMTDSKGCTTTTTTSIACTPCNLMLNQPTLLTVCNAPTATINISWSGGLAPYRLTYTGAVSPLTGLTTTSQQISNLVAGNYSITVIDANNCSQVVNFLVPIPSLVSVVVNSTNATNCTTSNGSISAVGSGGTPPYSYRWSNGSTSPMPTNLPAGAYTLTMTDSKGCVTLASTTIQCNSTCNLVMGQPTVLASCTGQTAQINVSWTGGQAPYNLTYSGPSIGNSNGISGIAHQLNNLPAGNYTISIIDANNCSQIKSVTVITPPLLSLTTSKTDAGVCVADNGSATVTASGGTIPYTYIWNNGKTTATISALAAGTYTPTVTDAAGCTKNQAIIVNSITDSLTAPLVSVISIGVDSILFGWSTVLNAARYEVQTNDSTWLPANGALRHTVRGLKPSQTVTFKVRGVAASPKCGARITRMQARTENEKCLAVLANTIPTTFTPGNNGKNDFFDPEKYLSLSGCSSNLQAEALNVFNQWGEIVFKAQPYEKWDGKSVTYQKIVPSGAYFYVLLIKSDGKTQPVKGVLNVFAD